MGGDCCLCCNNLAIFQVNLRGNKMGSHSVSSLSVLQMKMGLLVIVEGRENQAQMDKNVPGVGHLSCTPPTPVMFQQLLSTKTFVV